MKSTLLYSASLMACFPPLPKEQPGSLKGTCCLLIFNLLQAYLGICLFLLLPSLAHLPVPATRAGKKHYTFLENQAVTCTPCCSPPALSLPGVLCHSPFLACSQHNAGVVSDELHWKWHRWADKHAGGKLQSNLPLFLLGIMVRRTLNYMWHAVFIHDNMLLTEVYISYSIAGSCTNFICISIRVLTGILSAPKKF